jgi:flagellar protein FliL
MSTKNLTIVLVSVVLILGIMGGGFFFIWQKMSLTMAQVQGQQVVEEKQVQEKKAPKEPVFGPLYKMETMIVNLADQGGKRYLRVTMELELSTNQMVDEVERRMPQLRDAILMILPGKQYADIGTTEGKVTLREELMVKMNALLKKGSVKTIYFTEFIVQ